MNITSIEFPHLGIYLSNVPKSFFIFGFEIALYGVIIGCGVLLGILMAVSEAKRTGQNPDIYWDFSIYAIIFSIVGARVYYIALTWDYYRNHLGEIINTRGGGLAIYGGVIAAFITLFVYARIKKVNALTMADTGVLGLLVGQIIGRFGNFTNREAFGQYTDSLFAMRLPISAVRQNELSNSIVEHIIEGTGYIQVHPTFLYESIWNLFVLFVLLLYKKHKKFTGEITLFYLGGYGLGRFWIESLRTDQLTIGQTGIAISQIVAIICVIAAVIVDLLVRWKINNRHND